MSKITFIYAYEGEQWSTPFSVVSEFKSRGWDTEIISIGSNSSGTYHDKNLREWVESDSETDIVSFWDWGRFDSQWLDKKHKDAFWVQESGDDPQNFNKNKGKSHKFDFTFTPDYECYLQYQSMGVNVEWRTHFADTRTQYPMKLDPEYVAVTTRGRGGSRFLDKLTDWSDGAIGNQNGLMELEHTRFLNLGLMVIQNSRWGEITRRIFEGMACNQLVITDRLDDRSHLEDLFTHGEDIIFYHNMKECVDYINYYKNNDLERNEIAKSGYNNVLENHTQKNVADMIIKKWENWRGNETMGYT